ncbi:MAG: nicotinamide-nucleotide amidase [Pseudohongiellaceae bacterium]|jgi:nicotinamide-nucleotide amidase
MTETESILATLLPLTQVLATRLLARNLVMATAESCTGGGIASALTDLAGSSAWFDAGFITYSNSAKQRMLNVPRGLFAAGAPGAVSEETVRAMTAGAIRNSLAEVAVAVSGVAGPDGGSIAKPVGSVWIGWQWGDRQRAQLFNFPGDRAAVRAATVHAAISGLLELLD